MKIIIKNIKQHDADRLAASLLKIADRLFQNPAIQAEFKQWQQEKQRKGA